MAEMRKVRSLLMLKGSLGLNPFHSAILQDIFLQLSDVLVVD